MLYALLIGSFSFLLGLLWYLQKKHVSFGRRVLVALVCGVGMGLLNQAWSGDGIGLMVAYTAIGTTYVRLLQMIVIPLIFVSLLSAILGTHQGGQKIGKMASIVLGILLLFVLISASIGIALSLASDLSLDQIWAHKGQEETLAVTSVLDQSRSFDEQTLLQRLVYIVPTNPIGALAGIGNNAVLSTVFFAIMMGLAGLRLGRKDAELFQRLHQAVDVTRKWILSLVGMVLRLTPYGVFALMARFLAYNDFQAIIDMGKFVGVSYVALFFILCVHTLALALVGCNPLQYFLKAKDALVFAFVSRSSLASLPIVSHTLKDRMGVHGGLVHVGTSLAASTGQSACAGLYPAMLAVMVAPGVGIDPSSWDFIVRLLFMVVVGSLGIAGVGGGATYAALVVLPSMGLPVEIVGLLIAVEPIVDMGRTMVNNSGSLSANLIAARIVGEMDMDVFNDRETHKHVLHDAAEIHL